MGFVFKNIVACQCYGLMQADLLRFWLLGSIIWLCFICYYWRNDIVWKISSLTIAQCNYRAMNNINGSWTQHCHLGLLLIIRLCVRNRASSFCARLSQNYDFSSLSLIKPHETWYVCRIRTMEANSVIQIKYNVQWVILNR